MIKKLCLFFFIFSFIPSIFSCSDGDLERSGVGKVADKVVHKTKDIVAHSVVKVFAFFKILKTYLAKSVDVISETSDDVYNWAQKRTTKESSEEQKEIQHT